MRANRVADITSQKPPVRALACKHIEVIEPEIFHHSFELALAVHGAVNLGHGKLGNDSAGTLDFRELFLCLIEISVATFRHLRHRRAALLLHLLRVFLLRLARFLGRLRGRRILVEETAGGFIQGRILFLQPPVKSRVIDGLGTELFVNPLLETDLTDALGVARARAVCQAIHRMQDGLIFGKLRDWETALEFAVEGCRVGIAVLFVLLSAGIGGRNREKRGQKECNGNRKKCGAREVKTARITAGIHLRHFRVCVFALRPEDRLRFPS